MNGTIPGRSIRSCPVPPDTKTVQCPKLLALPQQTNEFLSRAISRLTAPVLSSNHTTTFSDQLLNSTFSRATASLLLHARAASGRSTTTEHSLGLGQPVLHGWAGHVLLTCTFKLVEQQAPCHHLPPALLCTTHVLSLLVRGASHRLVVRATRSLRSGRAVWGGRGAWLPVLWPQGSADVMIVSLRGELGMEIVCSEAQDVLPQYLPCERATWGVLTLVCRI